MAARDAALPISRYWLVGGRSALPSRRIARLLFFVREARIGVVVHGFIKKTQKTPAEDLQLARRRMKEMQL
jgi:phage-related protein